MCFRTRRECDQARAQVAGQSDPKDLPSRCAPQASAVCVRAQKNGGPVVTFCQPNAAMCRARVDDIRWRHAKDQRLLSECETTPQAASTGSPARGSPDAAHWWCVSFDAAAMGSCDRSRVQCDKGHDFVRRRGPGIQLSDCTPQETAICYQYIDAEGPHRLQCAPTMAICEASKRMQKDSPAGARLGFTDCHPVD